jgi:hypothetical protein
LTTGANLGIGILIAIVAYLVIGTAVTWWRHRNESSST